MTVFSHAIHASTQKSKKKTNLNEYCIFRCGIVITMELERKYELDDGITATIYNHVACCYNLLSMVLIIGEIALCGSYWKNIIYG